MKDQGNTITLIVSILANVWGLIPAFIFSNKAKEEGRDGGSYFKSFGIGIAIHIAIAIVFAILYFVLFIGLIAAGGN